jgi:hypothetical protein
MCIFATLHFASATVRLILRREPLRGCYTAEVIVCSDMPDIRDPPRDPEANINVCERADCGWEGHPVTL